MRITESELLDALVVASADNPDALTGPELARLANVGDRKLRAALKALAAQDRLVVHRVMRANVCGTMSPVPAYTILPRRKK